MVERRAAEPILPLHLFKLRTFSVTSIVGFIVGFALFGAITYLPAFFQVVRGISPTISGLYLLPLMAGLLVVSISSGQIISKTGKYRFFPIAGTALMTLGLYLLSLMGVGSSTLQDAASMLVLGMGIGGVMQVLVIIVQNGVPHSELGVATSGATFFRSIGGSFGTAIFGAIFANVLVGNLARHLHGISLPHGFSARGRHPGAAVPPARRGARRFRGRLRRVDPDRVPGRGAHRRARLPGHLADPAGGAQAVARGRRGGAQRGHAGGGHGDAASDGDAGGARPAGRRPHRSLTTCR